jgi:hypothetical protein
MDHHIRTEEQILIWREWEEIGSRNLMHTLDRLTSTQHTEKINNCNATSNLRGILVNLESESIQQAKMGMWALVAVVAAAPYSILEAPGHRRPQ